MNLSFVFILYFTISISVLNINYVYAVGTDTAKEILPQKICVAGTHTVTKSIEDLVKENPDLKDKNVSQTPSTVQIPQNSDFCTSEKISYIKKFIQGDGFATTKYLVKFETTCLCPNENVKKTVGCNPGQTVPTYTVVNEDMTMTGCSVKEVKLSKCATYKKTPAEVKIEYDKVCKPKEITNETPATKGSLGGIRSDPSKSIIGFGGDTDRYLQENLEHLGINEDDAKKILENSKNREQMVEALNSGNLEKIKESVLDSANNSGVELNDATKKNIANLTIPNASNEESNDEKFKQLSTGDGYAKRDNTFTGDGATQSPIQGVVGQCGVDGLAGNFMRLESGCGSRTSNNFSSVRGPYQFLCSTWTDYAIRTDNGQYANCAYANDVQVSSKVMNDSIDKIYKPQFGNTINQLGISQSAGLFVPHLLGEDGARKFFSAYRNNPNMSSDELRGYLGNVQIDNNHSVFYQGNTPRTLNGALAEIDRRLGIDSPSAPYAGAFANNRLYPPYAGRFNNSNGNDFASGGSPFTNITPAYFNNSRNRGSPSTPVYLPSAYQNNYQSQYGNGNNSNGYNAPPIPYLNVPIPANTSISNTSALPILSIIVDPTTITRGDTFMVSWSTANVRANYPCVVKTDQNKIIASGNGGSKRIFTSATTSLGVMNFLLECTSQVTGQLIQKRTSVNVK